MKNIPDVIEKYNSNPNFKKSFNEVVFSYLDEIMPNQSKSEQLKEFISNKDRKRFVVKAANLIDKVDQDLSDEMIEMEMDSIKTKLKNADKKLGLNEPDEIPTLNENIIRGESPDEHYEKIRAEIRTALEEAQDALAHRVKEKYGNDAGFNEYQRNKDEFEKYGISANASREFEAETFGNVDNVKKEFEDKMEMSRKRKSGSSYDNGIDYDFSVDTSGAEELLGQRSVNKKENTPTQRSQHRLRRGHD
jgi:hypothetical protein